MNIKNSKLRRIQFCALAVVALISIFPSLACIWDIINLNRPKRRPLISYHYNISPNALVFDEPHYFRHGELILTSQENEQIWLPINRIFFAEIDSHLVRAMDIHFFLLPDRRDKTYEVLKSFLRFKYCRGQSTNDSLKSIKYRFIQYSQSIEIETSCSTPI